MKLSIFTDETGLDLEQALPEIKKMGFENVDLRWKLFQKSFEKLTDEEMYEIKKMLDANGLKVQCLQSSLAKVHLPDAARLAEEMQKLEELRTSDPAAYKAGLVELSKKMKKDAKKAASEK